MSLRRIRPGELVALAGAVCVAIALALPCYHGPDGEVSAWSSFGPATALLIIAGVVAVGLIVATVTERTPAVPVATAVWSTLFGIVAVIAMIVRLLDRPEAASPAVGAWLGLVGALAIAAGSWESLRDERTGLYPPADIGERRPAPPTG